MQPLQFLGSLDDYGHSILQHHGSHLWECLHVDIVEEYTDLLMLLQRGIHCTVCVVLVFCI